MQQKVTVEKQQKRSENIRIHQKKMKKALKLANQISSVFDCEREANSSSLTLVSSITK